MKSITLPGQPHFVRVHGCASVSPLFRETADYRVFLHLLAESCRDRSVSILGYCLMSQHYHLVIVPESADAVDATMRHIDVEYAHYYHLRHMIRGQRPSSIHLPYRAFPLCWSYLWDALAYLEREPVRTRSAGAPWAHPWSSAGFRLGHQSTAPDWLDMDCWEKAWTPGQWKRRLQSTDGEQKFTQKIEEALEQNGVLGDLLSLPERKGPARETVRLRIAVASGQ